jgi:hypothetical protein
MESPLPTPNGIFFPGDVLTISWRVRVRKKNSNFQQGYLKEKIIKKK